MWARAEPPAPAITPTVGNKMPPGVPQPGGPQGGPNQQQQSGPGAKTTLQPGQQTPPVGAPAPQSGPQSANKENVPNIPGQQGPQSSSHRGGGRSGPSTHGQLQRQMSKSEDDGPKHRPRSREGGRPGHDDRGHNRGTRGEHDSSASNVHYRDNQDRRRDRDRNRSTSSDRIDRRGRDPRYSRDKQYTTPERGGDQDPHRPDKRHYPPNDRDREGRDRDGRRYSDESIRSNSTDKTDRSRYEQERYASENDKHRYQNEQHRRNRPGSRRERYPAREYDDTKPYPPEEGFHQDDLESLESYSGKDPLSRTSSGRSLDRQRRMYPEDPRYSHEQYQEHLGGDPRDMLEHRDPGSTPGDNFSDRRPIERTNRRNRRERSSPGGDLTRSPPRGSQYESSGTPSKRNQASPRHSITVEDVDASGSLVPDGFGAHGDPNRTVEGVPKHHLDPSSAVYNKVNKQQESRKVESMIRNDSLSSDQSECVRPPPPKPHKAKPSRAKRRQLSLSSSEEEIRSTPDYTSPDEGEIESESVSERGE